MLNDTGLEFDSSKEVLTIESESFEEGIIVESKMKKNKLGVVCKSLSYQIDNTRKNGSIEFEFLC